MCRLLMDWIVPSLKKNKKQYILKNKTKFDTLIDIPVHQGKHWSTGPAWPACLPEPSASPGRPDIPGQTPQVYFPLLMTRGQRAL